MEKNPRLKIIKLNLNFKTRLLLLLSEGIWKEFYKFFGGVVKYESICQLCYGSLENYLF